MLVAIAGVPRHVDTPYLLPETGSIVATVSAERRWSAEVFITDGERLKDIAFDLYERYVLLEPISKVFRPDGPVYRVLDVGGHTTALWPGFSSIVKSVIPDATTTVVDMIPSAQLRNYVQASGAQLPFRDGAFDLVCSLDTLEHIAAELRPAFLTELVRVTRDGLYLACPFDSASNRWADSLVAEYANVVLKSPIPALMEHLHFGLPDPEGVKSLFASTPYAWISFGQANTDVWLLMMLTYHTLRMPGTDFVHEINRRFNQVYAQQDWAEPHYRTGYLLSKRRGITDLSGIPASFGPAGNRADLQSVLALCELFLSIAQNQRVNVDKDRHIRNIETELDELRAYKAKWGEIAVTLENMERGVFGSSSPGSSQVGLADWPDVRLARLVAEVPKVRREEMSAQLEGIREEMRSQFEEIRGRSDAQWNNLEFQVRLDGRMRDLEIGLVTNKRAIQGIYESRIWKAFCGLGALFLRLTGGAGNDRIRSRPDQEARAAAHPIPSSHHEAADDFEALVCDHPGPEQTLPAREIVEIRGWALAKSGIASVSIRINDGAPLTASYGVPRPDVGRSYPKFTGAEQAGFRLFWDPTGLPDGPHSLRVIAVAHSGRSRETICNLLIDSKTPPGYGMWISRNEPTVEGLRRLRNEAGDFTMCPRVSIAVPVYKTPIAILTRCIESVLAQTYPNWELCLADDGSHDEALGRLLQEFADREPRIRIVGLGQNGGISAATNEALHLSTGEYVAFLDHDDELAPFALSEVVRAINDSPDTELFYSDEDKIDGEGRRFDAFLKPDWSPALFHSCNYICHFAVMKRSLMLSLGDMDVSFNGAQDYDFLLRASELTREIKRIPKVLYHWRAVPGSTAKALAEKPDASADGKRALILHLQRTAPGARVEEVGAGRYRVRYPIGGNPQVAILIPTGGNQSVFRAVEDVLEKTTYKNYDILLIDNSRTSRVQEYALRLAARQMPVRYFDWRGKPFNFSRMNNAAADTVAAPYILFLNDDTTIITAEWLTAMLEHAQQPEVGAVGAQLWYPNNLIQHAGVVMGLYGNCSHAFKGLPADLPHYYFDLPNVVRNCSAVTGACLLVARRKFIEAGAFDEVNLAVAFQDVDLCLKLLELGYRNVYTPYAKLYHYESATKTEKDKIPAAAEDAFMKRKWARYIADDPYYNPNLARRKEDFSLELD